MERGCGGCDLVFLFYHVSGGCLPIANHPRARSLDGVHRTFHTLDATVPGSVDDLSVSRRQMEGCFRSF